MVKGELRKQAYDIKQFDDPVFAMLPGSQGYQQFDESSLELVEAGSAGF